MKGSAARMPRLLKQQNRPTILHRHPRERGGENWEAEALLLGGLGQGLCCFRLTRPQGLTPSYCFFRL